MRAAWWAGLLPAHVDVVTQIHSDPGELKTQANLGREAWVHKFARRMQPRSPATS